MWKNREHPPLVASFDSLLASNDGEYDTKKKHGLWVSYDRVGFMPPQMKSDPNFLHWDQNVSCCLCQDGCFALLKANSAPFSLYASLAFEACKAFSVWLPTTRVLTRTSRARVVRVGRKLEAPRLKRADFGVYQAVRTTLFDLAKKTRAALTSRRIWFLVIGMPSYCCVYSHRSSVVPRDPSYHWLFKFVHKITVRDGWLIVWDSRTAHGNYPNTTTDKERFVQYITYK